jgi:mono/diheme cytochrome c family protein
MLFPSAILRLNHSMPENCHPRFCTLITAVIWTCVALALLLLMGCEVERRRSDAELGLNSQQAAGRRVYDEYCDRCHAPYSSRGRQGPGLKGVFKKPYLPISGIPANDARVGEIIRMGRNKMEGFGNVLIQQQVEDMLAYMHTL